MERNELPIYREKAEFVFYLKKNYVGDRGEIITCQGFTQNEERYLLVVGNTAVTLPRENVLYFHNQEAFTKNDVEELCGK